MCNSIITSQNMYIVHIQINFEKQMTINRAIYNISLLNLCKS